MLVSLNIADIGPRRTIGLLARPPKATAISGLRHLDIGIAAPLSGSLLKKPQPSRVSMIGFWDDEASLDAFLANDQRVHNLGGFAARLVPLRAHGSWPGLDADVSRSRNVSHDGAVIVLTLGRFRLSQAPRFFRTSAKAEAATTGADGLLWTTGLARPPFIATCSLWSSSDAARAYAYGSAPSAAHDEAISAGNTKAFHKQEAFIRFNPIAASGSLSGTNPLAADIVALL